MRRIAASVCLFLTTAAVSMAAGPWQRFEATAYSKEGQTASGKQTVEGRTVAADPDVLPIGTRIEVSDAGPYSGEYVVHDSGRKIAGREIDLFIDQPAEAKKFGKKTVRVRVLQPAKPSAGANK
ncbi:MAG TPA: 3D domain-containing protein [Bryobacteraceae bacterium]|nr:3D domain-containing protein [Bryobacteraceae bacterium]